MSIGIGDGAIKRRMIPPTKHHAALLLTENGRTKIKKAI